MIFEIPAFATLRIDTIVCDYNGTVAKDGKVLPDALTLMRCLAATYELYVLTADTFGTVEKELAGTQILVRKLHTEDHTREKAAFVEALGADRCAAIGNGNNDAAMLERAALGIAVMGTEGCATPTLLASDLVCRNAVEALELFLHPGRLTATLRR